MRVYFDSSALAKRYVDEAGSAEVLRWCDAASVLALSVIAVPELISAFSRLLREGRIDAQQYRTVKADLLADIEDALVCDISPDVVGHAVRALEAHPLRGTRHGCAAPRRRAGLRGRGVRLSRSAPVWRGARPRSARGSCLIAV